MDGSLVEKGDVLPDSKTGSKAVVVSDVFLIHEVVPAVYIMENDGNIVLASARREWWVLT